MQNTTSIRPVIYHHAEYVKKKGEDVQRLVTGCEKLAQEEYKRRHDNVAGNFVRRIS